MRPIYVPNIVVTDSTRVETLTRSLASERHALAKVRVATALHCCTPDEATCTKAGCGALGQARKELGTVKTKLAMIQADYGTTLAELTALRRATAANKRGTSSRQPPHSSHSVRRPNLLTQYALGLSSAAGSAPPVTLSTLPAPPLAPPAPGGFACDKASTGSEPEHIGRSGCTTPAVINMPHAEPSAGAGVRPPPAPDAAERTGSSSRQAAAFGAGVSLQHVVSVAVEDARRVCLATESGNLLVAARTRAGAGGSARFGFVTLCLARPQRGVLASVDVHKRPVTDMSFAADGCGGGLVITTSLDASIAFTNMATATCVLRYTLGLPALSCSWYVWRWWCHVAVSRPRSLHCHHGIAWRGVVAAGAPVAKWH